MEDWLTRRGDSDDSDGGFPTSRAPPPLHLATKYKRELDLDRKVWQFDHEYDKERP